MNFLRFFMQNEPKKIRAEEQRFDILREDPAPDTNGFNRFFLKKLREIVFRRKKNLPTKELQKQLKEYRRYDLDSK